MSDQDQITIRGIIKVIFDIQTFPSGFQKQEFVITTPGDYPQDLKMELMKDNCSKIDAFKVGDAVNVGLDLRGNEYNGKYYVNLICWRISPSQSVEGNQQAQGQETASESPRAAQDTQMPSADEDVNDQIPF